MMAVTVSALGFVVAPPLVAWLFPLPIASSGATQCSPCPISPAQEAALYRDIANHLLKDGSQVGRQSSDEFIHKAEELEEAVAKRETAARLLRTGAGRPFREAADRLIREAEGLEARSGSLSQINPAMARISPQPEDEVELEPLQP